MAFFNERYAAATGNYDIYVLFVERALQLLKPGGAMGFIVPNKFMQVDYGVGLRRLLSDNKYVERVVDFKESQVFEGATTYTCLLFLKKQVNPEVTYIPTGDRLSEHLGSLRELPSDLSGYTVQSSRLVDGAWHFPVGKDAGLFEHVAASHDKLGDVTDIFVGLQTSADDVFIMELVEEKQRTIRLASKALGTTWLFEKGLLFPLVSGKDVKGYRPLPERQYILFPYTVSQRETTLIGFQAISKRYPQVAAYLQKNKMRLEDREHGKAKGKHWYGYIYLKNMARQSIPKVCVPRLVDKLYAAYDESGNHFLDNVDVGGVVWKPPYERQGLKYLLALLNSRVLRWYFPFVSVPFRGGWFSANRQFLSQLPIRLIDFDDPADKKRHDAIVKKVEEMLHLQNDHAEAERDLEDRRHALKRRIEQVDAAIDRMVYELYGLTEEEIAVVEGGTGRLR